MAAAPPSFASIAGAAKPEEKALRNVEIDGHAALRILKHCQECAPALVTGQLLGLDVGQTLEVTDCFPFPLRGGEDDDAEEGATYQLDMMRCLREVNVDNNTVGWYQSTILGSYQTVELIDTFLNYQESIKRCMCIVHDPQRAAQGGLGLTAIKLADSFVDQHRAGNGVLTFDKLKAASISYKDIFEEIPIRVRNSALARALISTIQPEAAVSRAAGDRLAIGAGSQLERNLTFLNDSLDDVVGEQQKVTFYHRNFARQQQQLAQWQQKRRQENAARRAAGEDPLPEEDPVQFKPIPEPNPLDSYLLLNQVANLCDQLGCQSTQTLQKLYMLEGFQQRAS